MLPGSRGAAAAGEVGDGGVLLRKAPYAILAAEGVRGYRLRGLESPLTMGGGMGWDIADAVVGGREGNG